MKQYIGLLLFTAFCVNLSAAGVPTFWFVYDDRDSFKFRYIPDMPLSAVKAGIIGYLKSEYEAGRLSDSNNFSVLFAMTEEEVVARLQLVHMLPTAVGTPPQSSGSYFSYVSVPDEGTLRECGIRPNGLVTWQIRPDMGEEDLLAEDASELSVAEAEDLLTEEVSVAEVDEVSMPEDGEVIECPICLVDYEACNLVSYCAESSLHKLCSVCSNKVSLCPLCRAEWVLKG